MNELLQLPLRKKVGQLFFIGIGGKELGEDDRTLLDEVSPGGVCLFARNIEGRQQTRTLLDSIREISEVEPLFSVDQEGGLVDRLRRIMAPMPAAGRIRNVGQAAELGLIVGESLRILGFNMDFAPVVDVIDDDRSKNVNGLYSRTFGTSAREVTKFAGAFLESLQSVGCLGCLKHFPGLGASIVDSHEQLPEVSISVDELMKIDLAPYSDLLKTSEVSAVMVGHAAYPGTDLQEIGQNGKLLPSSLSRNVITDFLRNKLGFNGLVITDDLEMGAIVKHWGVAEASKMGLLAGADMLAICADPQSVIDSYRSVLAAVENGEIAESRIDETLIRLEVLRSKAPAPPEYSEERLTELTDRIVKLDQLISSEQ